jgi:hypothetical protein
VADSSKDTDGRYPGYQRGGFQPPKSAVSGENGNADFDTPPKQTEATLTDLNKFEPALGVSKIAKLAGTHPNTIYALIYGGKLRAVNLGTEENRNWRIPLSSWNEFLSNSPRRK